MHIGILIIFLGVIAAASLIVAKKPDAQKYINKLVPYQGFIGIAFALLGLWHLTSVVTEAQMLLSFAPTWWYLLLAISLVEVVLGFILGYSLIVKYVLSRSESAKQKGDELLAKLAPLQGKIGLVAIGLGLWALIYYFMYFTF